MIHAYSNVWKRGSGGKIYCLINGSVQMNIYYIIKQQLYQCSRFKENKTIRIKLYVNSENKINKK
jgi:hypothetical protein